MKYIILISLLISQLFSAPARGGVRDFIQADGSTFKASAKGNHHLNWIESVDGEILKYNQYTKNYEFAEIKNENLAPSGYKYINKNAKQMQSNNVKKIDKSQVYKLWKKRQADSNAKLLIKH